MGFAVFGAGKVCEPAGVRCGGVEASYCNEPQPEESPTVQLQA